MTASKIKPRLQKIFQEVFKELQDGKFDFAKTQDKFESWDSFSHMELVSKVEKEFKINLAIEDVVELDSPQKFVDLVEKETK